MRKFVIPSGSTLTSTDGTETDYLSKALEVEQKMKTTDNVVCDNAGLSLSGLGLPNFNGLVDPEVGEMPVVEGPPSIIGGVVQISRSCPVLRAARHSGFKNSVG